MSAEVRPFVRASVEALEAYRPGEQSAAPDLLKLNTNENPYPPSPRVAAALRDIDVASLRLYPPPCADALRKALADLHGVGPKCVFVGNGSDEVLRLAARAFTDDAPRGCAAMFEPTYSLYPVLCAAEEVRVARVPLAGDFGWREPDDAELDGATLFFMANPNAPTGVRYPDGAVAEFAERFGRRGGVLLLDEAYGDFADPPPPGERLARERSNVLMCRTFSKSCGLAGIRCGYAVGHPRLIDALDRLKDSYNLDAVTQRLALAAVGDREYLRGTVARIVATRERTARELEKKNWTVVPSQSNFLFARPPKGGPDAGEIFRRLRERHVFVRHFPSSPSTRDWLRISIGTDADMERLLALL
ncbi:MAG: aminotransferase class I/II-fold pyridoxal phosphate-dependent enzyme [Kiritimatiellae bacterium]|nr:aminotransferase class I/II-fold pyridoxal phosphate-dependent enzyme [Kiritimatiellia bacterium]